MLSRSGIFGVKKLEPKKEKENKDNKKDSEKE